MKAATTRSFLLRRACGDWAGRIESPNCSIPASCARRLDRARSRWRLATMAAPGFRWRNDWTTPKLAPAVTAERAVLASLGGGCQAPMGAHAFIKAEHEAKCFSSWRSSFRLMASGSSARKCKGPLPRLRVSAGRSAKNFSRTAENKFSMPCTARKHEQGLSGWRRAGRPWPDHVKGRKLLAIGRFHPLRQPGQRASARSRTQNIANAFMSAKRNRCTRFRRKKSAP